MSKKKIIWTIVTIILLIVSAIIYWRYFFVFAEGTKAGTLNTFQRRGYIFKTYEGKLIQSGFRANIQSNEFDFSVQNERVAKMLLENAGRDFELHYKRYFGIIPWRGNNEYIVDSVYEIRNTNGESVIKPK